MVFHWVASNQRLTLGVTAHTCIARFGRWKQKVHEFKVNLGYIVRLWLKSKIRDSKMAQWVRTLVPSLSVKYLGGRKGEKREPVSTDGLLTFTGVTWHFHAPTPPKWINKQKKMNKVLIKYESKYIYWESFRMWHLMFYLHLLTLLQFLIFKKLPLLGLDHVSYQAEASVPSSMYLLILHNLPKSLCTTKHINWNGSTYKE